MSSEALPILLGTMCECRGEGSATESAIYAMMELMKYG